MGYVYIPNISIDMTCFRYVNQNMISLFECYARTTDIFRTWAERWPQEGQERGISKNYPPTRPDWSSRGWSMSWDAAMLLTLPTSPLAADRGTRLGQGPLWSNTVGGGEVVSACLSSCIICVNAFYHLRLVNSQFCNIQIIHPAALYTIRSKLLLTCCCCAIINIHRFITGYGFPTYVQRYYLMVLF